MKIESLSISQCVELIEKKSLTTAQYYEMFRANRFGIINSKGKEQYLICDLLIKKNLLAKDLTHCNYFSHWLLIRENHELFNHYLSNLDFSKITDKNNPLFFSLIVTNSLLDEKLVSLTFAKKILDILHDNGMTVKLFSFQFNIILEELGENNKNYLQLLYYYCEKYKTFNQLYKISPNLFDRMESAKIILLKLNS